MNDMNDIYIVISGHRRYKYNWYFGALVKYHDLINEYGKAKIIYKGEIIRECK